MSEEIPQPPPPQPPYVPPPYVAPPAAVSPGLPPNTAAALAYITIIPAIIFLVIEPYNRTPLVRFHSFQSIALNVAAFVISIALFVLQSLMHFIPGLACLTGILFLIIHLALFVGFFVIWLMCILKASKGEWYKLPVIGDFADKQARS
jgi:uncharacterized membrane protein